jgi:hypothetical protein
VNEQTDQRPIRALRRLSSTTYSPGDREDQFVKPSIYGILARSPAQITKPKMTYPAAAQSLALLSQLSE